MATILCPQAILEVEDSSRGSHSWLPCGTIGTLAVAFGTAAKVVAPLRCGAPNVKSRGAVY